VSVYGFFKYISDLKSIYISMVYDFFDVVKALFINKVINGLKFLSKNSD